MCSFVVFTCFLKGGKKNLLWERPFGPEPLFIVHNKETWQKEYLFTKYFPLAASEIYLLTFSSSENN